MKPMISIIIPVYNVEKYIKKCVDSVLAQTYSNYEVILVDDGSTDRSGKICDDYFASSDMIRVLHQKNQGVAVARKNGVNISKGELIAFVDADDIISTEYLTYMYYLMEKYDADMSVAGMEFVDEQEQIPEGHKDGTEECLTNEEALIRCCYGVGICAGLYAKLYQRKMLEKYPNLPFQVWEDLYTVYHVIGDSEKIAVGSGVVYYYVQQEGSAIHGMMNEKKMSNAMAAMNGLLEYADANFPRAKQSAQMRCARAMMQCMQMIFNTPGNTRAYYIRVREFLKPQMKAVWKDDFVSFGFKMRCSAIMVGYGTCKIWGSVIDIMSHVRKKAKYLFSEKGFHK